MTEKKRYRLDCLNNVMDTNYDWLGHTSPFDQYVIDEDDYLIIGEAKTQRDGEEICKLLNKLTEKNEHLNETNQELYDFRLILNALLFNEWVKNGKYEVYKSKRHHDGSIPFPDDNEDWFIVVAILPSGQVTNHYHIKYWDYFKIPSYPKVKDEFDGHTSSVVLLRYGVLLE